MWFQTSYPRRIRITIPGNQVSAFYAAFATNKQVVLHELEGVVVIKATELKAPPLVQKRENIIVIEVDALVTGVIERLVEPGPIFSDDTITILHPGVLYDLMEPLRQYFR